MSEGEGCAMTGEHNIEPIIPRPEARCVRCDKPYHHPALYARAAAELTGLERLCNDCLTDYEADVARCWSESEGQEA